MKKMLILFLSTLLVSAVFAEDYHPGADFTVANKLMFHGDPTSVISQYLVHKV